MGAPLNKLYKAALIAADVDAHELIVRTLVGDTTTVITYHLTCFLLRAGCNISEMLIANNHKHAFARRSFVKYLRAYDASFSYAAMRIHIFNLPLNTMLPYLKKLSRRRSRRLTYRCRSRLARECQYKAH